MYIQTNCALCGKPVERKKQSDKANVQRHFCDMVCKSEYQKLAKPVTKEWLEEHYIEKHMDCVQIAKIVNRDSKSVWRWLKDFGIPTRGRGKGSDHLPKDGSAFRGKSHTDKTKQLIREIAVASGRVPYKPEVGPYMKGRSGASHPMWKGGITPERATFYASPEWKAACVFVWKRANACCERCGVKQTADKRGTFDIHHIVSFAVRELRADTNNLVLLCEGCHYFVHSKKNVNKEFIRVI